MCGSKAYLKSRSEFEGQSGYGNYYQIMCSGCGLRTRWFDDWTEDPKQRIVDYWNSLTKEDIEILPPKPIKPRYKINK